MVSLRARWPVILLVVLLSPAISFSQQQTWGAMVGGPGTRPDRPLPNGQRVTVSDGDTVVVEGDARVRMVRRRPAFVRMIADTERRFVIVIAEHLKAPNDGPTRLSDKAYTLSSVEGQWPLGARWEGAVWIEEEMSFDGFGLAGLLVETAQGAISFGRRGPYPDRRPDGDSVTLSFMGFGVNNQGSGKQPFDIVERQQVANAVQSAARNTMVMHSGASGSGGVGFSSEIVSRGTIGPVPSAPGGAVRVGGNIAPPRKIHHVDPVMPEQARAARVSGMVIVEITIGTDGAVSNARILRSIPLLDQAALDAVKEWRYEPTVLNGQAVPVIMTATVPFGPV